MRALAAWLAVALTAACATNEIRDPSEFTPPTRLPDEPLFGTIFHEGSLLRRTTVSSTFKTGPGYVYVYEGDGWDDELFFRAEESTFYRIDPLTGAGQEIAAPALPPSEAHSFGTAIAPESAILMVGRTDTVDFAYFDGAAWTAIPSRELSPITTRVVARSATDILAFDSNFIHHYNGSTWRVLPLHTQAAGNTIVPGPWDDAGARVVFSTNTTKVCTSLYTPSEIAAATAPAAAPFCLDVPNQGIAGTAVNGTTASFQVLVKTENNLNVRAVHFAGASSNVGSSFGGALTSTLITAPGSLRPLAATYTPGGVDSPSYVPELQVLEGGELADPMFDDTRVRSVCTCDRATDPDCGCFTREAVLAIVAVDAAASNLGLLIIDDVDARRKISMRMFPLPYSDEAFPGPQCDLVCSAPAVCVVDPISGSSNCVIPDPTAGKVTGYLIAQPADPATAGSQQATSTLTPASSSCGVSFVPNSNEVHLDPYCTYSLDATAPGHVSIHVDNIQTASENDPITIGPYTLARGGRLDAGPVAEPFVSDTRLSVSPATSRMILTIDGMWRWVASAGTAPYFTTASLVASPVSAFSSFGSSRPRWVGADRALVDTDTLSLALVENGAVASTLAGAYDLTRAAFARTASVAFVPSGTLVASATHPGVSSEATFLSYATSTLTATRTISTAGFGHTIRANGTQGAFFNTNGNLVLVDTAAGTTVEPGSWSNRAGLRVRLGGASDWLVVAPNATNPDPTAPCNTIQLCGVFAQEDIPGDPGDPVTRQTVSLSSRALWAEIGESVGHVVWLERDTSSVVHLYRRDTSTRTTTEIALGGSYANDLAHAAVGDKVVVMVPTGIVVVDIATGASRLEAGTFAAANVSDLEPLVRVDDGNRIWLREACVFGTDPCGLWSYDAIADAFTKLSRTEYPRFGPANDRAIDGGMVVTTYDNANVAIRSYTLAGGTSNAVESVFRTSRARGAPCIAYWRDEPGQPVGTRRWYCSD